MQPWFNSGHMIGMALWWALGLALLIGIACIGLTVIMRRTQRDDSPEEILKRRFAAEEITEEEYTRRLSALKK